VLSIPNIAPDGVSAPANAWFTIFGQGFDHGLDHINKGGNGKVYVPVLPGDPLYNPDSPQTNFMVVTRGTFATWQGVQTGNEPVAPDAFNQIFPEVTKDPAVALANDLIAVNAQLSALAGVTVYTETAVGGKSFRADDLTLVDEQGLPIAENSITPLVDMNQA
jgi:hypothetical protein